MYKKRFGITLIVVSTLVYGGIFFLSHYYGTGFFDEILIQLNRVSTSVNKKQEVAYTRQILKTILENEQPPAVWEKSIVSNTQNPPEQLFYYYKVWTVKTGLTMDEVIDSYPIFATETNHILFINMRYGKANPVLQFPLSRNKDGNLVTGLFFPINEPPFVADVNHDSRVDQEDVRLARKM